jgi:hypothetical protein
VKAGTMSKKQTQASRILELLSSGREVSALELSSVSLQYCARVSELREAGCVISNRVQIQRDGTRYGFYKLVCRPPILERADKRTQPQRKLSDSQPESLFRENEPRKVETFQYPD